MADEQRIQAKILGSLGSRPDCRIFRNTVGRAYQGRVEFNAIGPGRHVIHGARVVEFGLGTGSPDLVGWRTVTITPDMVGQKVAVFCGVEVKAEGGKPTIEQERFIGLMQRMGAFAGVARSVGEASAIVQPF